MDKWPKGSEKLAQENQEHQYRGVRNNFIQNERVTYKAIILVSILC